MKRPPHLSLPVDGLLDEVLGMLAVRPALVLRAPTGSGKTTRVPPALELAGLGPVLLVEPRRVAARAAARRMASERGEAVGESVGYRVRFDKKVSAKTRVCAVTEGVFLRQVLGDPFLEGVGCVVFDEFHERHLDGDLGLALARRVQLETRPDLKIVVLSATIDPGPLEVFLEAAVVDAPGKLFPIEVGFQAPRGREAIEAQVVRAVEATAGWLGEQQRKGAGVGRDMLVFLPGKGEIRRAEEALGRSLAGRLGLEVVPLHGDLDAKAQDRVLAPRKATEAARVILATNLAESSLTLDGLGAVIDSGLARIPRFDPGAGLDRLELVRIAMPSVLQRMGRAGRTGPGYNLRLWSPAEERTLPSGLEPEVARVDLTGALLSLADFGEPDPLAFDWFELPPRASSERGLALLRALGALGANAGITARGRVLATLPIHPRLGLLLLVGAERGIAERAALAAAVLSERDVCAGALAELEPERVHDSDLLERVELLEAVLAGRGPRRLSRGATGELFRIRDQLLRLTPKKRRNVAVPTTRDDSDEALLHSLFEAYPDRVSKRRGSSSEERTGARGGRGRLLQRVGGAGVDGARAQMVGGRGLALGNECRVREAELFLALDVGGAARGSNEVYVRMASIVRREWLGALEESVLCEVDESTGRVQPRRVLSWGGLVLDEVPLTTVGDGELKRAREAALVDFARRRPAVAFALEAPEIRELEARVAFVREALPESPNLPPAFEPEAFALANVEALVAGATCLADLAAVPLARRYLERLDYAEKRQLDEAAPLRLKLPNGEGRTLVWDKVRGPVLSVRIQQLFGWRETPRIGGGRAPVLLEMCAPNGRPQQVTSDLAGFWAGSYALVRKDLRGRYPKHPWPEDPANAEPIPPRSRRGRK